MSFYTILRFCVVPACFLGWIGYQAFFNRTRSRELLKADIFYVCLFLGAYAIMYYLLT